MTIALIAGLIVLAVIAQTYRYRYDWAMDHINTQYGWIDDIIKALENEDEDAGNESIDRLIDQRVNDGRSLDH